MSDNSIKVGFCVAYDWRLLAYSLPQVYYHADLIYLSVDRDRLSWARKPFEWHQSAFNELISKIDTSGKIVLYEDDFHAADLTPAENEVRQRSLMAEKMGDGGWHIQLDCDEYFIDFQGFVEFLRSRPTSNDNSNICCQLITIFKEVNGGFLYVFPNNKRHLEFLQVASRSPKYEHGRRNGHFNILSPFLIVHQSWARSEKEILEKLSNWGHVGDFDADQYFKLWKTVTAENFQNIENFHPLQADIWGSLKLVESRSIQGVIQHFRTTRFPTPGTFNRLFRNSLFVSRLRNGLRLIYKVISIRK